MRGFICDKCGEIQEGIPDLSVGETFNLRPELDQWGELELKFIGSLPRPDLCEKCKKEIARKILSD